MMRAGIFAVILPILISGCGGPDAETSVDTSVREPAARAQAAIEQAQARYQASWDAGHAWRQPRVLIDSAETALDAGDYEAAVQLAERATATAEMSLVQAEAERTAWRHRAPFAP